MHILYRIYDFIGYLIPLYLFLIAFIRIKQRGRYFFLAIIIIFYILPFISPIPVQGTALFIIRIILGIGCYLYLIGKGIPTGLKA
jgi:hypothetical protein